MTWKIQAAALLQRHPALCSHQDAGGLNAKHSYQESTPTKLQMHYTITRALYGHTDLLYLSIVLSVCVTWIVCINIPEA